MLAGGHNSTQWWSHDVSPGSGSRAHVLKLYLESPTPSGSSESSQETCTQQMDVRDKYMLRAYSYFLYTQPRAVHRRENTEQDTDITGVACSHLNK